MNNQLKDFEMKQKKSLCLIARNSMTIISQKINGQKKALKTHFIK